MQNNTLAALKASFMADSFALGPHWIYDVEDIVELFGQVEELTGPLPDSYHSGRQAGEHTHYGDQVLVLLESVAACNGFDLKDWFMRWKKLSTNYDGYLDGASKATLANIAEGKDSLHSGSTASDLSAAVRIAPVVAAYSTDLSAMIEAGKAQAAMTHNNKMVLDAAEFFARAAYAALKGSSVIQALETAASASYTTKRLPAWVEQGLKMKGEDSVKAIGVLGQACNVKGALTSTVQLLGRHPHNLREAFIENVMAGGDSAARGLGAGLILGAALGEEALPQDWYAGMRYGKKIEELGKKILQAQG